MIDLLAVSLATAYLTYVLVYTAGPWQVFATARQHAPDSVLHCPWCTAFWMAMLVGLGTGQPIHHAVAGAGGAMLLLAVSGVLYQHGQ